MENRPGYFSIAKATSSILTQPNMYARGILFGKMKYELGDHSVVRCPENSLVADVEFKTKGYFGGTYNAIGGAIRNEKTGEALFELSGMWSGEMFLKNIMVQDHLLILDGTADTPIIRPAIRSFCSTRLTQNIRLQWSDRWKSKTNGSHRNCGIRP